MCKKEPSIQTYLGLRSAQVVLDLHPSEQPRSTNATHCPLLLLLPYYYGRCGHSPLSPFRPRGNMMSAAVLSSNCQCMVFLTAWTDVAFLQTLLLKSVKKIRTTADAFFFPSSKVD